MKIAAGKTEPGKTQWKTYTYGGRPKGITLGVDTRAAGFTKTPNYVVSLCGKSRHSEVTGSSSLIDPTAKGFKMYLKFPTGELSTDIPEVKDWYVTWVAFEEVTSISIS